MLLAIVPAELESSILVEHNSTVNAGNRGLLYFKFEEGSAVVMAVTTAQLGQALAMRGFQAGN